MGVSSSFPILAVAKGRLTKLFVLGFGLWHVLTSNRPTERFAHYTILRSVATTIAPTAKIKRKIGSGSRS
uniref:Putative secreted protein n=1 Tax=Anopheles darlingi TaxID=43151 RepID=A0A2M4DI73_ANODA